MNQNPFHKKNIPDYRYFYTKPVIKILTDNSDFYAGTKSLTNISMRYNLHTLYKIKESDLLITDLLLGMNEKSRFTVNEITNVYTHTNLLCCLNFPFKNKIYIEISPLIQKYILTNEFRNLSKYDFKDVPLYTNGYLCWVIAQVYATIFKDHAEKAGVWGYCFRDLYIEQIKVCKDNLIKVSITD